MTTLKAVVFRHHQKKDGTFNVKIRVIHNGEHRFLPTNHYVTKDQLTRSFNIRDVSVIEMLEEIIRPMRKEIGKLGAVADNLTIDELIDVINTKVRQEDYFTLKFIEYGKKKCEEMKPATASVYYTAFSAIQRFTRTKDIDISEITATWLRNFVAYLEGEERLNVKKKVSRKKSKLAVDPQKTKKNSRACSLYTSCIRAIYNKAREEFNDEEKGVFPIPYNPFTRFQVPRPPAPKDKALSVEIIQRIIDFKPDRDNNGVSKGTHHLEELAKDMFLLSFGLLGMSGVDIYEMEKIKNGVIDYERKKVRDRRTDRARMMVRVEPEMREILNKYATKQEDKQLNVYEHYSFGMQSFNQSVNKGLVRIAAAIGVPKFTFAAARHSWATIAHNTAGIDKYLVHAAINHADSAMRVTDIYIRKDYSVFWEANRKVLDLFKWDNLSL